MQLDRLLVYSDADWGNDLDNRRSVSGTVITCNNMAICCKSEAQSATALSTTEAEYYVTSCAVQQLVWVRCLLRELGYPQTGPTVLFQDNKGCIGLSHNPILHTKSKHIDIRYHFVREQVAAGTVCLEYVESKHQLPDIFTKPLPKAAFTSLRHRIMGC